MRLAWLLPLLLGACGGGGASADARPLGATCGGIAGLTCGDGEYCDFANNGCGGDDSTGTCVARPSHCPPPPRGYGVCGCDRTVYQSDCLASIAGVDVDDRGSCTAPASTFACGAGFCDPATSYCQASLSDTGGANTYQCLPLPATCSGTGSCACLAAESCGTSCAATGAGFTLTCPGG